MEKELIVKPAAWSSDAADALSGVMPFCGVEELARQVEAGARLFEVSSQGENVGFYVLRVDRAAKGSEGVLVAAAGSLPGIDLTAELLPVIEKQFLGCNTLRVHTARPGLAKKLLSKGYEAGEIIIRKRLT